MELLKILMTGADVRIKIDNGSVNIKAAKLKKIAEEKE